MIPVSLLEHAPPALVIALPDVAAGLDVYPAELLPEGYSWAPCEAETAPERLHRDGRCCRCDAPEAAA